MPGGFGINDVRGVRSRPSRGVSLQELILAMAEGGQESLPEMSPEEIAREAQRKINREGLAGARRALEQGPSRVPDHLDDFVPDEDYGGDPQSQMSQQYLADMFARQAAQPQQGYFGGLGEALGGMSTQQKIALLVGLGLIPMTGGASSSMLGPALGVGAGLAATQ